MSEVRGGRMPSFDEVRRRLGATTGTQALSYPDVSDLADLLLEKLDARDVNDNVRFLRTGTKVMVAAFCGRLQHGLTQRHTTPAASDMLPKNAL